MLFIIQQMRTWRCTGWQFRCATLPPVSLSFGIQYGKNNCTETRNKENLYSVCRKKGFVTSMESAPFFFNFKKITDSEVWVFDIQWEKYGIPRFVVNFGKCSREGIWLNGKHYTEAEIIPSIIPGFCRLQPGKGNSLDNWFRQDIHWIKRLFSKQKLNSPEYIVHQLINLFAELEAYFTDSTIGDHLRIYPTKTEQQHLQGPGDETPPGL